MKTRYGVPLIVLLTLGLVGGVWAGPRPGPSAAGEPAGSAVDAAVQAARINAGLESLARALAASLRDAELRAIVKLETGRRFDGDFDALYASLANRPLTGGRTLRQALAAGLASTSRATARQAAGFASVTALDRFTASLPRLHVSVPVHHAGWDTASQVPLVAVAPVGVDEADLTHIKAFDAAGNLYLIDAAAVPDSAVVVVGLNERTDTNGYLVQPAVMECPEEPMLVGGGLVALCDGGGGGGGGGSGGGVGGASCDGTAAHAFGDPEKFMDILITNTHEPWYKGDPEIFIRWTDPNDGQRVARQLSEVNETNRTYSQGFVMFNWNTPSASGFILEVREQDGGFPGDDDDNLGDAYVRFSDANCARYTTGNGEAVFNLTFK